MNELRLSFTLQAENGIIYEKGLEGDKLKRRIAIDQTLYKKQAGVVMDDPDNNILSILNATTSFLSVGMLRNENGLEIEPITN